MNSATWHLVRKHAMHSLDNGTLDILSQIPTEVLSGHDVLFLITGNDILSTAAVSFCGFVK